MTDLEQLASQLHDAPGSARAPELAAQLMTALEALDAPDETSVAVVSRGALVISRLGFAERAMALCRRWRQDAEEDFALQRAEAICATCSRPAVAAHELTDLDTPDAAWLGVVNDVRRGELDAAIVACRAHGWFVDDLDAADGLAHGLWALALDGELDAADAILQAWRARHGAAAAAHEPMLARTEAVMASCRLDYRLQLKRLEEAAAAAESHDPFAHAFVEPALAVARVTVGNTERGLAVIDAWPARDDAPESSTLEAYRDLARLDVGLLTGELDTAFAAGERTWRFVESTGNGVLACHVVIARACCAPDAAFPAAYDDARRTVQRFSVRRYRDRFSVLQQLTLDGTRPARSVRVTERSRRGSVTHPIVRVFTPRLDSIAANLYGDCVQRKLFVGGRGPFDVSAHPVLHRMLEALLGAPTFRLPVDVLFQQVWETDYDPVRHEGRLHVTVHRLRRWLQTRAGRSDLLDAGDGSVGFHPSTDIRVLGSRETCMQPTCDTDAAHVDRLCEVLASGPLAIAALERHLGVGRTRTHQILRRAIDADRVVRDGRGRSTRYRLR